MNKLNDLLSENRPALGTVNPTITRIEMVIFQFIISLVEYTNAMTAHDSIIKFIVSMMRWLFIFLIHNPL